MNLRHTLPGFASWMFKLLFIMLLYNVCHVVGWQLPHCLTRGLTRSQGTNVIVHVQVCISCHYVCSSQFEPVLYIIKGTFLLLICKICAKTFKM